MTADRDGEGEVNAMLDRLANGCGSFIDQREAAKMITASLAEGAGGWIAVGERLPKRWQSCLCVSEGWHTVHSLLVWDGFKWNVGQTDSVYKAHVTHWQPLPAAPGSATKPAALPVVEWPEVPSEEMLEAGILARESFFKKCEDASIARGHSGRTYAYDGRELLADEMRAMRAAHVLSAPGGRKDEL